MIKVSYKVIHTIDSITTTDELVVEERVFDRGYPCQIQVKGHIIGGFNDGLDFDLASAEIHSETALEHFLDYCIVTRTRLQADFADCDEEVCEACQ